MSHPNPAPVVPPWLSRSVVILLALQVGLLWTHGSLLQRQHDDIQALREDIQTLAESLDQDPDGWDSEEMDPAPAPHPARWARRQGGHLARAAFLRAEDEGDQALNDLKKDQDAVRKSERDAVAKAHDVQEKMSIQANIEKAEAKARLEAEGETWKPWLWAGGAVVVLALAVRAYFRRRG